MRLSLVIGNFHTIIVCDRSHGEKASKILADVQRRAVELEGTITGEHGIGLGLRDMLVYEMGDSGVDMMRRVCCQRFVINSDIC